MTVSSYPRPSSTGTAAATLDFSTAPSAVQTMPAAVAIVPTYNEADNVRTIWARLRRTAPDVGLLFVDDNSPDGTGYIEDSLAADDVLTWVLHRPCKSGLGPAYAEGIAWALHHGAGYIIQMDADGSHDPAALAAMLGAAAAGADLVIGSRYVPGGTTVGWSSRRHVLSRVGNAYARTMLRLRANDATSGFRVYRAEALQNVNLSNIVSQGYCFQIEMTLAISLAGMHIREVPIRFAQRELGKSKMSLPVTIEALLRVTHWSLTGRRCTAIPAREPSTPLSDSARDPQDRPLSNPVHA